MLRIEYKGNVYDWFDLNDPATFELQRSDDFLSIVRHNIWQYYGVPPEAQVLFDRASQAEVDSEARVKRLIQRKAPLVRLVDTRVSEEAHAKKMATLQTNSAWYLGQEDEQLGGESPLQRNLFSSGLRAPQVQVIDVDANADRNLTRAVQQQAQANNFSRQALDAASHMHEYDKIAALEKDKKLNDVDLDETALALGLMTTVHDDLGISKIPGLKPPPFLSLSKFERFLERQRKEVGQQTKLDAVPEADDVDVNAGAYTQTQLLQA